MTTRRMLLGALAVFVVAPSASAERASRGVADVASIQDGEGNSRVLVHWDPALEAANVAIRRALLRFELSGEPESRTLRIAVHPITVPWSAADVDWSRGWSTPGGDFNPEIVATAELELSRGASTAYVDVSNVLKSALEAGEPFHGFLVTANPADGIGFRDDDLGRFAGMANATIEMTWRKVPAPPTELRLEGDGR